MTDTKTMLELADEIEQHTDSGGVILNETESAIIVAVLRAVTEPDWKATAERAKIAANRVVEDARVDPAQLQQVYRAAAPSVPAEVREAFSVRSVGNAMTDAWNEICSDTDCHPLDITHHGKKLFFAPGHWAALIARLLFARSIADSLAVLPQPPACCNGRAPPQECACAMLAGDWDGQQQLANIEAGARAIAISHGNDPDDPAPLSEMCTADNQPVPWWKVFEEQAEACINALPHLPPAAEPVAWRTPLQSGAYQLTSQKDVAALWRDNDALVEPLYASSPAAQTGVREEEK